jgi:hypothetical protein
MRDRDSSQPDRHPEPLRCNLMVPAKSGLAVLSHEPRHAYEKRIVRQSGRRAYRSDARDRLRLRGTTAPLLLRTGPTAAAARRGATVNPAAAVRLHESATDASRWGGTGPARPGGRGDSHRALRGICLGSRLLGLERPLGMDWRTLGVTATSRSHLDPWPLGTPTLGPALLGARPLAVSLPGPVATWHPASAAAGPGCPAA